ncbi:MAG TPA: transposase [Burkholderiales bacterium]|nr:transposase [Burkholderiales bacterium]
MLAGVPVHVIQRGNNRGPCFVNDEDRNFYLFHLGRNLGRFECELHAYCLMTNHVHLLLTSKGAENCAVLMKHMGQLHSQYFNKRYKRTGSLWEGRFRSCLVQSEGYVLACYRYIELNPVRASMVIHPRDYPWSSYRDNVLGEAVSQLTTPHSEYLRLGATAEERHKVYAALFGSIADSERLEEIRAATNGGYALGDEVFRRTMTRALGRRVEKGRPGRPLRDTTPGDAQEELPLPPRENVVCP